MWRTFGGGHWPGGPQLDDALLLGRGQRRELVPEQVRRQRRVDRGGHDGQRLQRRDRRNGQSGHSGADRVGDAVGQRPGRRREGLGDEERVPAGDPVQRRRIPGAGHRRDGRRRERREVQVRHRPPGRRAEQRLHRVPGAEPLLAHGEHQQCRQPRDPARDVPHHVEGGVVGPVHVIDDQQRRPGRQLRDGGVEHVVFVGVSGGVGKGVGERPCHPPHCLPQRSERARREQVVTAARQNPYPGRHAPQEGSQQTRLPDPGLARDHHDRSLARRRAGQRGTQGGQLRVPFPQPMHLASLPPDRRTPLFSFLERRVRGLIRPGRGRDGE